MICKFPPPSADILSTLPKQTKTLLIMVPVYFNRTREERPQCGSVTGDKGVQSVHTFKIRGGGVGGQRQPEVMS